LHGLAIPLDEIVPGDAEAVPAAEMGEEPPGHARWRCRLAPAEAAHGLPVENSILEVDPGAALALDRRRRGNRAGARAGVEADQYEAGDMLERVPLGNDLPVNLLAARRRVWTTVARQQAQSSCATSLRLKMAETRAEVGVDRRQVGGLFGLRWCSCPE
jgi:hypothetical protein